MRCTAIMFAQQQRRHLGAGALTHEWLEELRRREKLRRLAIIIYVMLTMEKMSNGSGRHIVKIG